MREDLERTVAIYKKLPNLLNNESHRGQIIIVSCMIEEILGSLIQASLEESPSTTWLLSKGGPINSFHSRIAMARALSLINDDLVSDFKALKDIRNNLAHQIEQPFETQAFQDKVSTLKIGGIVERMEKAPPGIRCVAAALALHRELITVAKRFANSAHPSG